MNDITEPSSVRLTQDDVRCIRRAVEQLLERRHWALNFPFDLSDTSLMLMLNSTIPDYVVQAVDIVNANTPDTFLNKVRWTSVGVDGVIMQISLDSEQAVAGREYTADQAFYKVKQDNPYYAELSEWARDAERLRQRVGSAENLLKDVLDYCNTSGQLFRAWPDLLKYMPQYIKDQLQNSTRSSRLPDNLDMVLVNKLRPDASSLLALLSMLPETDNTDQYKVTV